MPLDWLDAFLITGLFSVFMIMGLALLLHLQLGLARIANFGVVGFWGLGMYVFGVLYVQRRLAVRRPLAVPRLRRRSRPSWRASPASVVGWLIADLDTDGVLVVTLGFASHRADPGHHRGRPDRGFARPRRAPHPLRRRQGEGGRVRLAAGARGGSRAPCSCTPGRSTARPYGRLLIATGSNEALARSLGKSTYRTKLWMFALTSAAMGLLGAMSAAMVRYLDIGNIGVGVTLAAMVGLVLGGTARVWGAVIGVILTVGLFDIVIRFYVPLPREWYTQAIPDAAGGRLRGHAHHRPHVPAPGHPRRYAA